MYHSKASLFVSIKQLVSLFHEAPPDGTWRLSLKRGGNIFRQSWKYNMLDQIFFQLVFWFISKMTIYRHISSFADFLMFKTPKEKEFPLLGRCYYFSPTFELFLAVYSHIDSYNKALTQSSCWRFPVLGLPLQQPANFERLKAVFGCRMRK